MLFLRVCEQFSRQQSLKQSLGDEGGGKQNCAFAPLQKDAAHLETQAWQAAARHQKFRVKHVQLFERVITRSM
jgi:hypothetical protein